MKIWDFYDIIRTWATVLNRVGRQPSLSVNVEEKPSGGEEPVMGKNVSKERELKALRWGHVMIWCLRTRNEVCDFGAVI